MKRISRVASLSVRGTTGFARTTSTFLRGLATPATTTAATTGERPVTGFDVTGTGVRIYAHGVEYDMDFSRNLPQEEREVLAHRYDYQPVKSISEFASRWGGQYPELVHQTRELETLLNQTEAGHERRASRPEVYLRDLNVQTILERASSRDVSPVEIALGHFWSAYYEVPSPSGKPLRETPQTVVARVKSLLQSQKAPAANDRRAQTAAIAKYVQAKSLDEKVEAAVKLLGSKGSDLTAALKGVNDAAKKEQIVKQHLQWDEATKEAAALTERHPEFVELKEVLNFFPPLVHFIGEPSKATYKFKHLVDASFQKWQQSNKITSPDEIVEKDSLIKDLRGLIFSGKSSADAKKAQALQRTFPALLYTRDSEAFWNYFTKDETVNSQIPELSKASLEEYPDSPSAVLEKDFKKAVTLFANQSDELLKLQDKWLKSKIAFIDSKIQEGLAEMDRFVNGTVHDILAEHPEWEKAIEEDIVNHRWDPEMEVKEHNAAVADYYAHHSRHA